MTPIILTLTVVAMLLILGVGLGHWLRELRKRDYGEDD